MPRRTRLDLPDMPLHIVQRGNNRQPTFKEQIGKTLSRTVRTPVRGRPRKFIARQHRARFHYRRGSTLTPFFVFRWKNGLLNALAMLMLAPALGACSSEKKVEWTEDVRLSDGRMIVVQRYEEYRRVTDPGAGFRTGWLFQKSRISAELPAPIQRKVSWEGSLIPLVLDIQPDKSVLLVSMVATGAGRTEWKLPRLEYYVVFRLTNGGWQRIPLAELPLSVKPNLLGSTETLFIDRGARSGIHVDLKLKEELDSNPRLPQRFKSIIRLPAPGTK